jgi:hypothetical protein
MESRLANEASVPKLHPRRIDHVATHARYGEALRFEFAVRLNGLIPEQCGKTAYQVRTSPGHPLLTHPLAMGLMLWL